MGDLSGKLGALRLEPLTANPRKTYSFYDDNLHLLGPLTSEYILLITLTFVQLNQNVILTQVIHHFTKLKYVQYMTSCTSHIVHYIYIYIYVCRIMQKLYFGFAFTKQYYLSIFINAVFGHSVVVYGTGAQSGQVLGCANIEPSLVAEEEIEISFPRNGTDPGDVDRCVFTYTLLKHALQGDT